MQQIVYRRQGHGSSELGLQRGFDLAHYENAALACTLKKWFEQLNFLGMGEVLAMPTTARRWRVIGNHLSGDELIAQSAGPAR